ncbi:MAG: OmpA family protein [Desulfobacterales bacterium]|nr:OmpA family protein [Desulfobacterales bacterium]
MARMGRVAFIGLLVVAWMGAHAYGAQSESGRVMLSTVYFENDSAVIAAEFENDLKKVRAKLEADSAIGLQIEGYGRNHGTPEQDRAISQKRAEAVRQWFVKNGVDASRLAVKPSGDSETAAGKARPKDPVLKERVEIIQVPLKRPMAHLPALRYEFAPVMEGQEVIHDFVVQNRGSAPLEIQKVKTD